MLFMNLRSLTLIGLLSTSLSITPALAAQILPIEEEFQVVDPGLRKLRTLHQSGSLIIDHVTSQGYEVYGPKGTREYLSSLGLIHAGIPKSLPAPGYPSHEDHTAKLKDLATRFPNIAKLTSIGKSVQGRDLWVLKISDNVQQDELEPETKLISSMHGDEITGRELLMRLAADMLESYGRDPLITQLIDTTEIYLMPSMNPDGSKLRQRANKNGVDLNRSFPDFSTRDNQNNPAGRPVEVAAVMNWQASRQFALSANYHGGTFVVNYPWDTIADPFPLDRMVRTLSSEYASQVPDFVSSREFPGGITNGYDWYEVNGGMQDWSYFWHNDLQVTIEVSETKWPDYADMPGYYSANRTPMLRFLTRSHQGAGFQITGQPSAQGKVEIFQSTSGGTEKNLGRYGFVRGEFFKILEAGSYRFAITLDGGTTRSMQATVTDSVTNLLDTAVYQKL